MRKNRSIEAYDQLHNRRNHNSVLTKVIINTTFWIMNYVLTLTYCTRQYKYPSSCCNKYWNNKYTV